MNKEQKRATNFLEGEVELLVTLKHKDCIESKKSNAVTWKEKEKGWEELTKEFNDENKKHGHDFERTPVNLRNKWDNLKKNTRKKFAIEKQNFYKTGGGPPCPSVITTIDEELKEVIGVSCTGLENAFDSDRFEIITDEHGGDLNDVIDVIDGDKSPMPWTAWNPSTLKQPVSKQLIYTKEQQKITSGPVITDESTEAQPNSTTTPHKEKENTFQGRVCVTPRNTRKRKCEVTQDARANITALSKVRIDLAKFQIDYYKAEIIHKQEEHDLRMKQMKEIHALDIEIKKAELENLKKKWDLNFTKVQ